MGPSFLATRGNLSFFQLRELANCLRICHRKNKKKTENAYLSPKQYEKDSSPPDKIMKKTENAYLPQK